ncbi:MAG: hypothetical protein MI867_23950 [Pseudomonadales bacterium]|nr:hypothetical protein [Pseudomonadales bacterium]
MKIFKVIAPFVFVVLATHATLSHGAISFMGKAFNPDTEAFLYREIHCEPKSDQPAQVVYLTEEDVVLAKKKFAISSKKDIPNLANMEHLKWLPQYQFTHLEFGISEAVSFLNGNILLERKTQKQDSPESKTLNPSSLSVDKPLIADAGFDTFIKSHFDELMNGISKKVVYLSAPRLSEIDFVISYEKTKDSLAIFSVYPDNFVIRWLVDPIRVSYDIKTKRLMRFEGLTNVPMTPKKNFIADINYQYSDFLNEGPFNDFCN